MKQLVAFLPILFFVFLLCASTLFQVGNTQQQEHESYKKSKQPSSTVVFRVGGAVYPDGFFYATTHIGQPPRPYHLDIDTGSDVTWVQCDAPCTNCLKAPHSPYKPSHNIVKCEHPLCAFIQHPKNYPCVDQNDQCDYEIEYADHGVSRGVLVNDHFSLKLVNGSSVQLPLTFGCGYDQDVSQETEAPFIDGVLGVANGKSSILSQLRDMGVIRNVFAHCFCAQGGGYAFFGDGLVPSAGVIWTPMHQNLVGKYYASGPAELLFGGKKAVDNGLQMVFDSGSTFAYFNSQAYEATLAMIKQGIDPKELEQTSEDDTLPICWKGKKPFKSVGIVKKLFKPLTLGFLNAKMEIKPDAYLIVSEKGSVCLGILNGSKADLGELNLLGDNFMLDKMVIYDNEKQRIGWIPAACDKFPKTERDNRKGLFQFHASYSGSTEEYDEL